VRFLIDAQLPSRLADFLSSAGHDVVHTNSLPAGNRSSDRQVAEAADADDRVVVTKDSDFRNSHLISGTPKRLLVVATGNITNDSLLALFERSLGAIVESLVGCDFIELHRDSLVVHAQGPSRHGPDPHGPSPSPPR
jgi:predicted nuclease of predicted toxin-antitoxin system